MIHSLRHALTSRMAGPVATALAMVLAATLGLAWADWTADRAVLERRIAELTQQADRSQSLWKAQLAACHAAAGANRLTEAAYESSGGTPGGDPKDAARRLLSQQPEGIDVCARMESADQAVLSTLK